MIHLLNTQSDDPGSVANYAIAQYFVEPLRQEGRNVGVLVEKDGEVAMRFVGESFGNWDASSLRFLEKPSVYKLWVDNWRKKSETLPLSDILAKGSENFHLVRGGEVAVPHVENVDDICNYLFGVLVSKAGLESVLSDESEDLGRRLKNDIQATFRELEVLSTSKRARYPVKSRKVKGKNTWHPVTFFQEGPKQCFAMEPLDLTIRNRNHIRDRASYLCLMFDDIRQFEVRGKPVSTLALLRGDASAQKDEVAYTLGILREANKTVNWESTNERKAFLHNVERTAFAA